MSESAPTNLPPETPPPTGIPPASATAASEPTIAGGKARTESANQRFIRQVAEKRASLDDFEPEETLWTGCYSPKAMIGTWSLTLVVSIALIACAIIYRQPPAMITLGIIALGWGVVFAVYLARRLGLSYELTTQRFIHQSGLLTRRTDRIEVIDIDDVSFKQGPIQRILDVGTIDIASTDRSHPHLIMRGISEVKQVAGLIDDVRRRERKRRSLHIQ